MWTDANCGLCLEAKYAVRFMRDGENKIDAGYVAHPSFVERDELSAIKGPLSISAAGTPGSYFLVSGHACLLSLCRN